MTTSRNRIDPDLAPGGLVFRVRRHDRTVVWFEPVPDMDALTTGELRQLTDRHHEVAMANTAPGAPSVLHVFDGDTGDCTAAFVIIATEPGFDQ